MTLRHYNITIRHNKKPPAVVKTKTQKVFFGQLDKNPAAEESQQRRQRERETERAAVETGGILHFQ